MKWMKKGERGKEGGVLKEKQNTRKKYELNIIIDTVWEISFAFKNETARTLENIMKYYDPVGYKC